LTRPRIALLGRFTESASALRYRGVVSSRALLESVWLAGGDPVTLLPGDSADALDWASRLRGFDGVLLCGGGDIHPRRYGMEADNPALYDIDELQDEADFTLARYALDHGIPTLAVCRGLQVVNALLGGTLTIDLGEDHHRHVLHDVALDDPDNVLGLPPVVKASCYHHQAIDRVADGLTVLGRSAEGYVEAAAIAANGWAAGVQWHPEDTAATDPDQVALLRRFLSECSA
jgi:putative glutamine amidotransferase